MQVALVSGTWQVQVGSGALTGVHTYTFDLVETLSGAAGSPKTTSGVSVSETILTLGVLRLSNNSFISGFPQGTFIGNVLGAAPGSVITIASQTVAGAIQIANVSGIYQLQIGPSPLLGAQGYTIALTETLTAAAGSPKTTSGLFVGEIATFQSAVQMRIDSNSPANVQLRDRSNQWATLLTVDPTTHIPVWQGARSGDTSALTSAGSGLLGETISQSAVTQAIASATPTNITSKQIPGGHWNCQGYLKTNPAGTTTQSAIQVSINQISATDGAGLATQKVLPNNSAGVGANINLGPTRFDFAIPTTLFLVGDVSYAVSTLTADGGLSCTRQW
jgi:hypothetical protein